QIGSPLARLLLEGGFGGVRFLARLDVDFFETNLGLPLRVLHHRPGSTLRLCLLPADEGAVEEVIGPGQEGGEDQEDGEDQVHRTPQSATRRRRGSCAVSRSGPGFGRSGVGRLEPPAWPCGADYLNLASQRGNPALTSGFPLAEDAHREQTRIPVQIVLA